MTSKTHSARPSSDERITALRLKLQTAFLIGGFKQHEIHAHLEELATLQSRLQRVPLEALHPKGAAA